MLHYSVLGSFVRVKVANIVCSVCALVESRISEALAVVVLEFALMKLALMVHLMCSLRQRCSFNILVL